jgi:dihydroflavonol-4-reductase
MKVLVTGPDGVLGSNLVRELIKRDHDISVLLLEGSRSPTLSGLEIKKHYGNILNAKDLENCIAGKDIVIHCAASTSIFPARDEFVNKTNIEGTQNIIDACLKHKIHRLIHIGTANSFGYGTTTENPGNEENPYVSEKYGLDYMDSKRKAQEIILKSVEKEGLPAVIVNPTFILGPYDSKPSAGTMVLAIHKGKIPGYTKGGKNYVAAKDVSIAVANALTMGRIGQCYILGNENLLYKEAFKKIADVIGAKAPTLKFSPFIAKSYGSLTSFFARIFKFHPTVTKELAAISCDTHFYSSEKARKELGLPVTPIEEAVKECFDWFKENDYLNKI